METDGRHLVYVRRVDPSVLDFSLSSHRHSRISLFVKQSLRNPGGLGPEKVCICVFNKSGGVCGIAVVVLRTHSDHTQQFCLPIFIELAAVSRRLTCAGTCTVTTRQRGGAG